MAITRVANRKVYNFRSSGESTELSSKLAKSGVEPPPVGLKTPLALSDDGKNFLEMHKNYIELAKFKKQTTLSINL